MILIASPARLACADADFDAQFQARLHWAADTDAAIEARVADILADVQKRGDAAVLAYSLTMTAIATASNLVMGIVFLRAGAKLGLKEMTEEAQHEIDAEAAASSEEIAAETRQAAELSATTH